MLAWKRCAALVTALAIGAGAAAAEDPLQYPRPLSVNPQYAEGFVLYQVHCSTCHGERGDGRGPTARLFDPRPADFTTGTFKLRSTPSGSLPTDEDLTRTLTRGVHRTAMRGFATTLEPREMAEVLKTVKSFSPRFGYSAPRLPVWVPPAPERTLALEVRGREVYRERNCATCHGDVGRGDGPSSAGLSDERGHPARPHDFTVTHHVKAGPNPEDIYRSLVTGLDGTPMHDASSLSESDRWALVYFLISISEQPSPDLGRGGTFGRRFVAPATRGDAP